MLKKRSDVFLLIVWLVFCCIDAFAGTNDIVFTDVETGLMWPTRDNGFDYEYGNRDWGYPMSTVDARVLAVRDL